MFFARLAYYWADMGEELIVEFVLFVDVNEPVYSSTPNDVKWVVMQSTRVVVIC